MPALLVLAGVAVLVAGAVTLRSFGPGYRVGRLLATTRRVPVEAARELAGGRPAYVRVDGRIDSEDSFEDAARRPLVLRRTRVQVLRGGGWSTVEDGTERVPFEVRDGLVAIGIDTDVLADGLVVVPRFSTGTAADLAGRLPADTPAGLPARVRIDQISAVEHATVLGVPVVAADGEVRLTAGLGRPLVLTTLEIDEAMRVLAEGRRVREAAAAVLLAGGGLLVAAGLLIGLAQAAVALLGSPAGRLAG